MSEKKRILIVGGVAGGASAAARARRLSEKAQIIMFERGEYISFANCGLPYHIGGVIENRNRLLVQTPEAMTKRFNIDVRNNTEVLKIDPQRKEILVRRLADGKEMTESYDTLILSPGAEPVRPPIPGADDEKVFTLRSIPDMDKINQAIMHEKPSNAVVIGGGYIGLEMAEALVNRGIKVSIVELQPQVFGPIDPEMACPIHQHLKLKGVNLELNTSVTQIDKNGDRLDVHLNNGDSIPCGLVIMAVGIRPEVALAKQAGLKTGERGGIVVDESMRTSDPDIYAVGDAVEVTDFVGKFKEIVPLAGPANRQGRIAADNAFGRKSVYKNTQGTAICKVFDLAVAMTGMSEKALKRTGAAYEKIYVHPANHAGYYPGASQISLKLLFEPQNGKILGAQAVGTKGVDKRIDVIAVAIRAGMTVFDLQDLELCYAPPFGSAKDPVNYAGFVASNFIAGDMDICHTADVLEPRSDQLLLDVRTAAEVKGGTIPGAINIEIDQLRQRLGELPKDKELLVFCQVGLRGYLACRILKQNGFKCKNLTGGYKTYIACEGLAQAYEPGSKEMSDDTGEKSICKIVTAKRPEPKIKIDATALQCPGPIMKLKAAIDELKVSEAVGIKSSDPGFISDISSWCHSTNNKLANVESKEGVYNVTVVKGDTQAKSDVVRSKGKNKTIIVFSNDFDKAMAAFIIANGAATMGSDVTMFFTFWGINLLRKSQSVSVKKNLIEKMFGFMMPRGPEKTSLSKMNMGGMGLAMIKGIMRKKNVSSLSELIDSAVKNGVRLVACTMSMDLMGIKQEELIDGVEQGGVAMYLDHAEAGNVNLFI